MSKERLNQFNEECQEISRQCVEEGYPSHGSVYELRVEDLIRNSYSDLFLGFGDDDEDTEPYPYITEEVADRVLGGADNE